MSAFQTEASRESHRCARAAHGGAVLPPLQLPAVQLLAAGGRWAHMPSTGSHFTLVATGNHKLDSSGGIPPLPSLGASVQHLREEIPAQIEFGGMG